MNDTAAPAPLSHRDWSAIRVAFLANFLWINASEVFRYFAFVMPMMREAFPQIAGVAPMDWGVFAIWGVWDTILTLAATLVPWLVFRQFGATAVNALRAGASVWLGIFVILWLGLYNMGLATAEIVMVALPLALLEMVVAAFIMRWAVLRAG